MVDGLCPLIIVAATTLQFNHRRCYNSSVQHSCGAEGLLQSKVGQICFLHSTESVSAIQGKEVNVCNSNSSQIVRCVDLQFNDEVSVIGIPMWHTHPLYL